MNKLMNVLKVLAIVLFLGMVSFETVDCVQTRAELNDIESSVRMLELKKDDNVSFLQRDEIGYGKYEISYLKEDTLEDGTITLRYVYEDWNVVDRLLS